MPAKKKRPARPRKRRGTAAAPLVVVQAEPPKPVIEPPQARRFWRVVRTKNLIGGAMFILGLGFHIGYLLSDKQHLHDRVALILGFLLELFGAHLMSSDPTERALGALAKTAGRLLPFAKKVDGTAEQPAHPSGQ